MSPVLIRRKYLSFAFVTFISATAAIALITACSDQAKAKLNLIHKDAPKEGVVAKIGGEEITEEQLIGDDKLDFFDLKKREYDLKMARLEKLMIDKLVGQEAQKAQMSTEDYINKKVIGSEIKISDAEFKKFIAEKHIPESQLNPQIKDRINAYLQTMKKQDLVQAHLAKLTKSNPVEVYFKKPKLQVPVEAGDAPMTGKKDAGVTIVEFSDFQCPFCSRGAEIVTQIKKKYGGKVKIAFKHFPLPMHHDARAVAEASMCVHEQNADKFWSFHDLVFKNQDKLDKASLEKFVKDVKADVKKYNECMDSKKFADYVKKDMEYGEKIGVKSTPTFFVNGQLISGAVPLETFSEIIDEELSAKHD